MAGQSHFEKEVTIIKTRETGLGLANPMLLHIRNEARVKLREWAEAESVCVNAIEVSMLEEFFKQLRKSRALRNELRQEIRATEETIPRTGRLPQFRQSAVFSVYCGRLRGVVPS